MLFQELHECREGALDQDDYDKKPGGTTRERTEKWRCWISTSRIRILCTTVCLTHTNGYITHTRSHITYTCFCIALSHDPSTTVCQQYDTVSSPRSPYLKYIGTRSYYFVYALTCNTITPHILDMMYCFVSLECSILLFSVL